MEAGWLGPGAGANGLEGRQEKLESLECRATAVGVSRWVGVSTPRASTRIETSSL